MSEGCSLPFKNPSPPPQRSLLDIEPLRIPGNVTKRLMNTIERRRVLVVAFEVGDEVELPRPLVAVGVVVEAAVDRRDAVLRGLRVAMDGTAGARVDVRIEVRVAIERRLLPPLAALGNRQDDGVARDAAGLALRGTAIGEVVQLRARIARRPFRAVNRDHVADIAETATELGFEFVQPRPVLARHLHHVLRGRNTRIGVMIAVGNEELNRLARLRFARAVRVVVVEVAARHLATGRAQLRQRRLVIEADNDEQKFRVRQIGGGAGVGHQRLSEVSADSANFQMASASPACSLSPVVAHPRSSSPGTELPITTGSPANSSISRSLKLSPTAITSSRATPSCAARHASARPLVAAGAVTSIKEKSRCTYSVSETAKAPDAARSSSTSARMVSTPPLNIT